MPNQFYPSTFVADLLTKFSTGASAVIIQVIKVFAELEQPIKTLSILLVSSRGCYYSGFFLPPRPK